MRHCGRRQCTEQLQHYRDGGKRWEAVITLSNGDVLGETLTGEDVRGEKL